MADNTSWGPDDIEKGFGFHRASIESEAIAHTQEHTEIRIQFKDFMEYLDRTIPAGRAKSIVKTKMQEASFWTHWGIYENLPVVDDSDDATSHYMPLVTDAKIDRAEEEEEGMRQADWSFRDDDYPGAPLKGQ